MNWYERSDLTECAADRREFLNGVSTMYGPQGSMFSAVGPVILGYIVGKTLYGRFR